MSPKKYLRVSSRDDDKLAIFLATLYEVARDMEVNVQAVRVSE